MQQMRVSQNSPPPRSSSPPPPPERPVLEDPDLAEDPVILPDHLQSLVDRAMMQIAEEEKEMNDFS